MAIPDVTISAVRFFDVSSCNYRVRQIKVIPCRVLLISQLRILDTRRSANEWKTSGSVKANYCYRYLYYHNLLSLLQTHKAIIYYRQAYR